MSFELVLDAPGPDLAGVAAGYAGFVESAPAPVAFREIPCTYVPLTIDLGDGWSVSGPHRPGMERERLSASGGRVAFGDLARELGWSHRRLIARFREEVGLPPKTVARIVRFERLRALLGAEPRIGLARAAAGCGFSDQAHLAREARDLAGTTPSALRAEDVNCVQDHPVPSSWPGRTPLNEARGAAR